MKVAGEDGKAFDPTKVKVVSGETIFVAQESSELQVLLKGEEKTVINGVVIVSPPISPRFQGYIFRTSDPKIVELMKAHRTFRTGKVRLFEDVVQQKVQAEADKIVKALSGDSEVSRLVKARLRAQAGSQAPQTA